MVKIKWLFIASLVILLLALPVLTACPAEEKPPQTTATPTTTTTTPTPPTQVTLYIGGTYSLTGAYAEDTAAHLYAFQDYVKYVNETKQMAPWRDDKFPNNVTLEVLWRDDELKTAKMLPIYEELRAMGILTYRIGSSDAAYALMDRLNEDRIGASSMASGPYFLSPPRTVFITYPLYTDSLAAAAEWFLENWTEDRAPRLAFLTADSPLGRSIEIPEMAAYLEGLGYEIVGSQYVPMVPTTPPTTQLMWLKENKVDFAPGVTIDPGGQATIKEAVRLDMGPHLANKITFAFATPVHLEVMIRAMGEMGNGVVCAGDFPPRDDNTLGMNFLKELQDKYRPDNKIVHPVYVNGLLEGMIQVEAVRLALLEVPADELEPADVLEYGFYKIKNLDTGELSPTPLTYGPGDVQGIDAIRVDQIQGGKMVKMGVWPVRGIYTRE